MAATIFQQSWGAVNSQITITITALSNGAFRQSDEVSNLVTKFLDAHLQVIVGTQSSAISSSGTVEVYAYGNVGAPFRTDTAGATDAAIVNIPNARLVGIVQANSGSTIYTAGPFSVANAFGGILPQKWGIILANRTGLHLTNSAGVTGLYFGGYYELGS